MQHAVATQALSQRYGVVITNARVVQVERLEVGIIFQLLAEPHSVGVANVLHVRDGLAA